MYKKLKNKFGKATALVISLALAVTLTVAGSLAYLVTHTEEVINYFTPARVTCEVEETFNGTTKSSVKIENTGTTDAYIRIAVIANWCNSAREIVKPWTGTISYNDTYWEQGADGYYYYLKDVSAGGSTEEFLSEAISDGVIDDLHLEMTIIAQAIQADGVDDDGNSPVVLAWTSVTGIEDDGTLIIDGEVTE